MYKILVADSEPESLAVIQKVVEQEIHDAKIVAVVGNGHDAVVETINNEPDLILVEIKIMGLNGLDTIARIRSFNQNVRIIIVSGYDYFEFAKRAMLLEVNDYLLKPISERLLCEALKSQFEKVREKREREQAYRKEENQYANALRFVEQHFIFSTIYNLDQDGRFEQYKNLIGVGDYGYILGVTIEPSFLRNHWDVERVSNRVCRRLKDVVGKYAPCAIGPRMLNRYTVFVTANSSKAGKEEQSESISLARDIIRDLRDTFGLEGKVTIGGTKPIRDIYESYQEAIRSYRYDNESAIIYYKEVRYKSSLRESYMELTEELVERIRYDKQGMEESFLRILEVLRPLPSSERLMRLIEIFMAISYEFRKELKNQDVYYDYISQCDGLVNLEIAEQERWACDRLSYLVKVMKSGKHDRKSSIVAMAMEYVRKHYNEDISLNDISHYVNLSPQHFSKIFKETTNFNYVEWVNNLRVTKAKEYMNQEDYTIKEICYLVGYKDPNYFSRIFKKYVGVSPTEYVKERSI